MEEKRQLEQKVSEYESNLHNVDTLRLEYEKLRQEMLTTIRPLEADNDWYSNELQKVKGTYTEEIKRLSAVPKMESKETQYELPRNKSKPKAREIKSPRELQDDRRVLILCDQNGYNLGNKLQTRLSDYKIETFIRPYATFEVITENLESISQTFTGSDYIIILGGYNNFINRQCQISTKHLLSSLKQCSHTNFIFVSVPYINFNSKINDYIYNFNNNLKKCLIQLDRYTKESFTFVDINSEHGRLSKTELVSLFINQIRNSTKIFKTLIFVNTSSGNFLNENDHTIADASLVGDSQIEMNKTNVEREVCSSVNMGTQTTAENNTEEFRTNNKDNFLCQGEEPSTPPKKTQKI